MASGCSWVMRLYIYLMNDHLMMSGPYPDMGYVPRSCRGTCTETFVGKLAGRRPRGPALHPEPGMVLFCPGSLGLGCIL
jgi:hypothetical protein